MHAVILAAGKGTRCHPLTLTRPKPLLPVGGTTILEHNLQQLDGLVDEAVLVIGYLGAQIRQRIGGRFGKIRVRYVEQPEAAGTGHALLQAKPLVRGRFLVVGGDDLHFREDIAACLRQPYAIVGREMEQMELFGSLEIAAGAGFQKPVVGRLAGIREKSGAGTMANTGVYLVDDGIFKMPRWPSPRGEFELTDMVSAFCKTRPLAVVRSTSWIPVTYPWSLLEANEILLKTLRRGIRGTVERGAVLNGRIAVGKGSVIRSGAYIEGPVVIGRDCVIGPNCYIRPSTHIGDNCKVGQAVEVKNSILMDSVHMNHLAYFGDSVIGSSVNIGAGTVAANLRHDGQPVLSAVNGRLVQSRRRKLGTVIGDGAHTGINTSLYPGRKLWPGAATLPGAVVKEDVTGP